MPESEHDVEYARQALRAIYTVTSAQKPTFSIMDEFVPTLRAQTGRIMLPLSVNMEHLASPDSTMLVLALETAAKVVTREELRALPTLSRSLDAFVRMLETYYHEGQLPVWLACFYKGIKHERSKMAELREYLGNLIIDTSAH